MLLELFLVNFLRKSTLGGLPKVLKPVDISGRASMVANQRYYVPVENSSLDVDFKVTFTDPLKVIVYCVDAAHQ